MILTRAEREGIDKSLLGVKYEKACKKAIKTSVVFKQKAAKLHKTLTKSEHKAKALNRLSQRKALKKQVLLHRSRHKCKKLSHDLTKATQRLRALQKQFVAECLRRKVQLPPQIAALKAKVKQTLKTAKHDAGFLNTMLRSTKVGHLPTQRKASGIHKYKKLRQAQRQIDKKLQTLAKAYDVAPQSFKRQIVIAIHKLKNKKNVLIPKQLRVITKSLAPSQRYPKVPSSSKLELKPSVKRQNPSKVVLKPKTKTLIKQSRKKFAATPHKKKVVNNAKNIPQALSTISRKLRNIHESLQGYMQIAKWSQVKEKVPSPKERAEIRKRRYRLIQGLQASKVVLGKLRAKTEALGQKIQQLPRLQANKLHNKYMKLLNTLKIVQAYRQQVKAAIKQV